MIFGVHPLALTLALAPFAAFVVIISIFLYLTKRRR